VSIELGTQLEAPEGLGVLLKGNVYYFLWSDAEHEITHLVYFVECPPRVTRTHGKERRENPRPLAVHVTVRRKIFEDGVDDRLILPCEEQLTMPPWLGDRSPDVAKVDEGRQKKGRISHQARLARILSHIKPIADDYRRILSSPNPTAEINRHARACSPKQNEARLRFCFFVYLAFKKNEAALTYRAVQGKWDRCAEAHKGKKFGRRSRHGRLSGHGSNDAQLRANVRKWFVEAARAGMTLVSIVRRILTEKIGCRTRRDEHGSQVYYHPEGKPFPNRRQLIRLILREMGAEEVRKLLKGAKRVRDEQTESLGPFSEALANAMERAEADGYWVPEIVISRAHGTALPPLVVVRIRCSATGMMVGIGFSLGGESAAAYRMAKFCAAISKVRFCALLGLRIDAEEWPVEGMPAELIVDRGPGSTPRAAAVEVDAGPAIQGVAPVYSGQSKATIEASNPKKVKVGGKPGHVASNMSLMDLVKREILRTVADCDAIRVTWRLTPDLVAKGTRASPLGLWSALTAVGRNDAIPMTFEQAVRSYLTKVVFKIKADGVYLHGQRYDSPALRKTGVLKGLRSNKQATLEGYALDMCVRHAWVETRGGLIEVDAQLPLRDDDSQLFISLSELQKIDDVRRSLDADMVEHSDAVRAHAEVRFKEETGRSWHDGRRRSGRPKRGTQAARKAARQVKGVVTPRRRPT